MPFMRGLKNIFIYYKRTGVKPFKTLKTVIVLPNHMLLRYPNEYSVIILSNHYYHYSIEYQFHDKACFQ